MITTLLSFFLVTSFASTSAGEWDWDQAWEHSEQFQPLPAGRKTFGHTDAEVWVKVDWTRTEPAGERLLLSNWSMNLDEWEVRFRGDKDWDGPLHQLGDNQPSEPGAEPWMPGIEIPAGAAGSALLRFRSTNSLTVDLRLERHRDVESLRALAMVTMGFAIGFLTLMILFNTFMVLVVRDPLYLWYTAYLASTLAYVAVYTGFLQSFFPGWKPFQNHWDVPLESLNIVTALAFAYRANDFGQIRGALAVAVFLTASSLFGVLVHGVGDHQAAIQIENTVFAASLVACAFGAVVQALRGNRMSRFFLVGYSLILVTVLIALFGAAGTFGTLIDSYWSTHSIGLGILLETVMFSAALADRVHLMQRELNRHVERSFQLDRLSTLGLVAAQVGHEVNSPNHVISLNAVLIESLLKNQERRAHTATEEGRQPQEDPSDRARIHEALSAVRQASSQIRTVVEDLRAGVARPLDLVKIDLGETVRTTVKLYEPLWRSLSDRLSVRIPARPVWIRADRARIQQLLVNLVNNALQSLDDRRSAVTVSVVTGEGPALVVEDEGPGLPAAMRPQGDTLFHTTRKGQGGTGLGLSIVAQVAREHQAVLAFSAVEPHGLKVTVEFPPSP